MKILLLLLLIAPLSLAVAQHGTAPDGFYPPGYFGDTWTGEVISADDNTREIILRYAKKDKTETFVATFPEGFTVTMRQNPQYKLKPSDIPLGTRVMVFYLPKTKKMNGTKVKFNEVFNIKTVPKDQKS